MENTAMQALMLFLAHQSPSALVMILFALIGSPLAVTVIVLVAWIKDNRKQATTLSAYRSDMDKALKSYGEHIAQLAEYYEHNVELVKSWQQIAEGFRDTVVLNTQTLTEVCQLIKTNQYCPHVRINKAARGPQS